MLYQFGKRIKTESQKVLVANYYVCRSYRRRTGRGSFCPRHPEYVKELVTVQFKSVVKVLEKQHITCEDYSIMLLKLLLCNFEYILTLQLI